MLKNSLNLRVFTPCSLQAVIEENLEDKKIKGFGSRVKNPLYINVLFSLFSILQPPNISLLHGLLMCTAFCTQIHAVPYVTISKQI